MTSVAGSAPGRAPEAAESSINKAGDDNEVVDEIVVISSVTAVNTFYL